MKLSRSQDFAKGVGGLFGKLETIVNKLDSNYHQSQIRLRRFSAQNEVISKKKGLHRNSEHFSAQNQVISKKIKGLHVH